MGGGRLPLEAKIDRPLLDKNRPPSRRRTKHPHPLKNLWIFGAEVAAAFLKHILSNLAKKLKLAPHLLIYPYVRLFF